MRLDPLGKALVEAAAWARLLDADGSKTEAKLNRYLASACLMWTIKAGAGTLDVERAIEARVKELAPEKEVEHVVHPKADRVDA